MRKGVYGLRNAAGRVTPIARGERADLPDEEAARLVGLGVASYTDAPVVAPMPPPDGDKSPEVSTDTSGNELATQAATGGERADPDGAEVARLERMSKADLEQMAQDMGVDISGAKNNRERAVLIAAEGTPDNGEAPPDLGAGDIVQ